MTPADVLRAHEQLHDVRGWLAPLDAQVLAVVLDQQTTGGITGDVLEVGVYEGRSAIFLARLLAPGERLVACDLFGDPAPNAANQTENQAQYRSLQRQTFDQNCTRYLAELPELPEVHQCPSGELAGRLPAGRFRLVHLDGSHSYEVVRSDIELACGLLGPGGVVVFDDYRSLHTPGVAAAAWTAVSGGGLSALCATPSKLYTAVDAGAWNTDVLRAQLATLGATVEEDEVAGRTLLRLSAAAPADGGAKGLARSLTPPAVWRLAGVGAAAYRRRRY